MEKIEYGSRDNKVSVLLDRKYHDGGSGHDLLSLSAGNEKSGLYFGLVTNVRWETHFKHDGMQDKLFEKSTLGLKQTYHLADIAKAFEIHDKEFPYDSSLFAVEKGKGFIRYTGFEEVDIYGTKYHDFIPYLNGREYHGGEGTDVFYADWRNWTTDITWKNSDEAVTFTPGINTLPTVTISGMEKLYLYLGSGNDYVVLPDYGEVHGGAGNDHLTIIGLGGAVLYGGEGNDRFGDAGTIRKYKDQIRPIRMVGGPGDDTYYFNQQVIIEEMPNEGTDTIIAEEKDFDLRNYPNIENLTNYALEPGGTLQGNVLDNRIENAGGIGVAMRGHTGSDTYIVHRADDDIIEQNDEGIDTVLTTLSYYVLPPNVENLSALAIRMIDKYIFTGNELGNTITGDNGNDHISGQGGNDLLYGRSGDDWLNGGLGEDQMWGGEGDDTYFVEALGDKVYEKPGEGIDEVVISLAVYTLPDNIERLDSTNDSKNILTGNRLDNFIRGNSQDDRLYGKAGNDELHGRNGNDLLDGGEGTDTMYGGAGDDRYYVDDAGDKVIEKANEGRDTVFSTIDYDLSKADNIHIENAVLQGTGNLTLQGNNEANLLKGNAGNNHLKGLAGNDWLEGGEGDDILNGNAGADRMIGGTGNDVYYVDNRGDVVVEEANGGRDTVNVFFDYDLMKVAHIENAILIGTANAGLQGNNEANLLKGNAGNNHLKGLAGNDWLEGGAGDDILNGNAGADRMIGGTGNDVYYVDNRGDVVVEEANGGRDTVNVFFDYDLMKVAHIENAALIGTANAGLQGNNGANLLKGNAGNNQLKGLGGNDWLDGGAGNDVLIGGSGKDTLVGGAGKDTFKFVDMADSTLSLRDVITDFKRGEDKIDLSVIDANTTQSGNQAFSFIGAAGFSAAGQVRFAGGVVYGDVNGDKQADFAIELKNVTTLQAGDFIL